MAVIKAFFDRNPKDINGFFTIQKTENGKTTKLIDRVPARSGQGGYTGSSWVRGKSPIPFTSEVGSVPYRLWLNPLNVGTRAGARGIGQFYNISTEENPNVIEMNGKQRLAIGLHEENALPGSAGCIVITVYDDFKDICEVLKNLSHKFKYINLEVL